MCWVKDESVRAEGREQGGHSAQTKVSEELLPKQQKFPLNTAPLGKKHTRQKVVSRSKKITMN